MTTQASNFIALCRGGSISTIKSLIKLQRPSIVKELQDYFGTTDPNKLANHLSLGR